MLLSFKIIFLLVPLIYVSSGLKIQKNLCSYSDEIATTTKKIINALSTLKENPEHLLPDVILGISITKASVMWSTDKLSKIKNQGAKKLITELEKLISLGDAIGKPFYTKNKLTFEGAHEKLWLGTLKDIKYNELKGTAPIPSVIDGKDCTLIEEYLLTGGPYYSDFCISMLFNDTCDVSEECWDSETNLEFHSGYKTTHRLFFLQIGKRVQCEKKNPKKFSKVDSMIKELCLKILLEAELIAKTDVPVKLRDIFAEQIALCGLEGYAEFAKPSWRKTLRSWEKGDGCFDGDNKYECEHDQWFTIKTGVEESQPARKRIKRTDSIMNNGCHTHIVAVTISAIAYHLRYMINECIQEINS